MRKFLEIAHTGLVALLLHPLRSLATMACLVAVLLPYLVGLAISSGVQQEAEASIDSGADLYVTGIQFGRNVPVPLYAVGKIKNIDGVRDVIPRIVGEIVLGKESVHAVVVGLPSEAFPTSSRRLTELLA